MSEVLYMDILRSDGNLTITKDEFARLCIEDTRNSLYGLSVAKVCWVVTKKSNHLLRVEGNDYHLPLKSEENVEVDKVLDQVELFDVYRSSDKEADKVLVILQEKGKEPVQFMVQGVSKPEVKKKVTPPKSGTPAASPGPSSSSTIPTSQQTTPPSTQAPNP